MRTTTINKKAVGSPPLKSQLTFESTDLQTPSPLTNFQAEQK